MKKIVSSLVLASLMIGSTSGLTAHASEKTLLSGNNLKKDYKIVMNEVKNKINAKQANSPDEVKIYNDFKKLYTPEQLESLNKNPDSLDQNKVKEKLKSVEVTNNQRKAVVLDDGSLVIIGNKTGPVEDSLTPKENTRLASVAIKKGTSGYKYYSTFYEEIWGWVKQAEVYNRVDFKLYTNKAEYLSSTPAGTRAFIPASIEVADHNVTGSGTRTLVNSYDYNATVAVVGTTLGNRYVTLGNTVKVISNVGDSVNYTTTPSYKGF